MPLPDRQDHPYDPHLSFLGELSKQLTYHQFHPAPLGFDYTHTDPALPHSSKRVILEYPDNISIYVHKTHAVASIWRHLQHDDPHEATDTRVTLQHNQDIETLSKLIHEIITLETI